MGLKYYRKNHPHNPILGSNALPLQFEDLRDSVGVSALDEDTDGQAISDLNNYVKRGVGGVVEIDVATYEELKKKLAPRSSPGTTKLRIADKGLQASAFYPSSSKKSPVEDVVAPASPAAVPAVAVVAPAPPVAAAAKSPSAAAKDGSKSEVLKRKPGRPPKIRTAKIGADGKVVAESPLATAS